MAMSRVIEIQRWDDLPQMLQALLNAVGFKDEEENGEEDEPVPSLEDQVDQLRHDLEVARVKIRRLEEWTSYEDRGGADSE